MKWFGRNWNSGVNDELKKVELKDGQQCAICNRLLGVNSVGLVIQIGTEENPVHIDCLMKYIGIERPEFKRASGLMECDICHKTYYKHPLFKSADCLDWDGQPFLHKLCDGRIVKL